MEIQYCATVDIQNYAGLVYAHYSASHRTDPAVALLFPVYQTREVNGGWEGRITVYSMVYILSDTAAKE
jgi:hypothetical protein